MTTTQPSPSIRKQLMIAAPIERAFKVFTAQMTSWWPRTYHVGKSPLAECVMEPRVNGRWFERGEDGSESEWGKVLIWEPPHRVVLAWQLDAEFRYDPSILTEVELTLTSLAPNATRADFEHRIDTLGPAADKVGPMMSEGWRMILEAYARDAESSSSAS